jgi:hypothetical protein
VTVFWYYRIELIYVPYWVNNIPCLAFTR